MRRFALAVFVVGAAFAANVANLTMASASIPVKGIFQCPQSRTCHYGPVYDSFPNYRSVCSYEDCNFVSAANWEQVAAGVTPSTSLLATDYAAAGQTFSGGLSLSDLWTYWQNSGIGGVYLTSVTTTNRSKANLENVIYNQRAVIVEAVFGAHSYLGSTKLPAGTAIMIADGYDPEGPLVVFQGRTIQMTWAQWNAEAGSVWGVVVSKTPPITTTPPTTTTTTTATPTTPTATPTATLSTSASNVPSAGGTVTLTFTSQNATSCSLSSIPSLWTSGSVSVNCNGTYQINVVPATVEQQWTFTFTATTATGQSASVQQTVVQSAPAPPATDTSNNWSGYVVPSSSALITDAQGDFVVPTLDCNDTPDGKVSIWVGIGGQSWASGGTSGSLLQTGVEASCSGGTQQDVGWWEIVPATPNNEQDFSSFPVLPGDAMQSSVYQTSTGAWATELTDVRTGLSAFMITGGSWGVGKTSASTFTTQGSAANISYSGGYTAEWIVEDPTDTSSQTYAPFADFAPVSFTNLASSFTTWSLTQSETWAIVQSGVTLATPTATTTDGFTVSYTGP